MIDDSSAPINAVAILTESAKADVPILHTVANSKLPHNPQIRSNTPLWNLWANLEAEAAYWDKVHYSNLSHYPNLAAAAWKEQPAPSIAAAKGYNPRVSVDSEPSLGGDLPVFDSGKDRHLPHDILDYRVDDSYDDLYMPEDDDEQQVEE